MMFVVGVVLFALGIAISIALHEAGHMWAARATGMRVRRYFIGFGPRVFSFRRGETEYGLKAIPLGGFCDIAGMTALDEMTPDEEPYAMYKQKTWKRLLVMVGGIAMNVVLGFVLVVALAVGWGLPDSSGKSWTIAATLSCVAPTQNEDGTYGSCTGPGPAQQAGVQPGDIIEAVNGVPTPTPDDVVNETQKIDTVAKLTIKRDDKELIVPINVVKAQRWVPNADGTKTSKTVSAVGVSLRVDNTVKHDIVSAIPASVGFTGDMFVKTAQALAQMPAKVADLWTAVTGGERAADTPISIYGASVIGGEAAERGVWEMFVGLLASLNFFLAAFNLVPLLPLDGGHIFIVLYERVRDFFRSKRGLAPGGPFDYVKLMPLTYALIIVGGAYMLLTLAADILNPIQW